jgi:multicomponent Na+:H+ antiporter subunit E
LRIAWDVVTPRAYRDPGIIEVPLELRDERAVALLVGIVTMTPGSLVVDVRDDLRAMYVHIMFGASDADAARHAIHVNFERRIGRLYQ